MSIFHFIITPSIYKKFHIITKSAKLNGQFFLWESKDHFVSATSVSLNAGKWPATYAVANAEATLDF